MDRPKIVTNEHLEYLDELRESGITNMLGAPAYLKRSFGIDDKTASDIFSYWKDSFGKEDR